MKLQGAGTLLSRLTAAINFSRGESLLKVLPLHNEICSEVYHQTYPIFLWGEKG
jgi:hypothetical protein